MFGTIRLRTKVNFIHTKSIILERRIDAIPIMPTISDTNSNHETFSTKYSIKKPTVIVKTVFTGSDFIDFILIKIRYR